MTTTARSPNPSIQGSRGSRTTSLDVRASGGHTQNEPIRSALGQEQFSISQHMSNLGQAQAGWAMPQAQQSHQMPQYSPALPQSGRESWDFPTYMSGAYSSMTAAPGSTHQLMPYHRPSTSSMTSSEQDQGQQLTSQSYGVYGFGTSTSTSSGQHTSNA